MRPGSAVIFPEIVQALPKLPGAAVRLAVALGKYADATGRAHPSNRVLMADTGIVDWRTFKAARAELARLGLRWTAGRGKTFTEYQWVCLERTGSTQGAESVTTTEPVAVPESVMTPVSESVISRHSRTPHRTPHSPSHSLSANAKGCKSKTRAAKTTGPNVWRGWAEAHRRAGLPDPLRQGPDLKAGKGIGDMMRRGELTGGMVDALFDLYLADDDAWLQERGHALRYLGGRLQGYLNRIRETEPPELSPERIEELESSAAEAETTRTTE